jgi:hypothetical protein
MAQHFRGHLVVNGHAGVEPLQSANDQQELINSRIQKLMQKLSELVRQFQLNEAKIGGASTQEPTLEPARVLVNRRFTIRLLFQLTITGRTSDFRQKMQDYIWDGIRIEFSILFEGSIQDSSPVVVKVQPL